MTDLTYTGWGVGEDTESYNHDCAECAVLPKFVTFRNVDSIKSIVDNRSLEESQNHWLYTTRYWLDYREYLPLLAFLDGLGNPQCCKLAVTRNVSLTPTFIYYASEMALLQRRFGSLNGLHVVEFGGGFGGLASIIANVFDVASYTIFDLPNVCKLQQSFFRAANIRTVQCLSTLPNVVQNCDLGISSYAFSEMKKPLKRSVATSLFGKATRLFITWHSRSDLLSDISILGHPDMVGCTALDSFPHPYAHLQYVKGNTL